MTDFRLEDTQRALRTINKGDLASLLATDPVNACIRAVQEVTRDLERSRANREPAVLRDKLWTALQAVTMYGWQRDL